MERQITRQQLLDLLMDSNNGKLILKLLGEGGCISAVRPSGDRQFQIELSRFSGDMTIRVTISD